jgi:hypothetical protein
MQENPATPLTTLRDERRDTIVVEQHTRTVSINNVTKDEIDNRAKV